MADCRKLRPTGLYDGRQGFTYNEGVSAQSVGSQGICMHLLTIPPAAAPGRTSMRAMRRRSMCSRARQ